MIPAVPGSARGHEFSRSLKTPALPRRQSSAKFPTFALTSFYQQPPNGKATCCVPPERFASKKYQGLSATAGNACRERSVCGAMYFSGGDATAGCRHQRQHLSGPPSRREPGRQTARSRVEQTALSLRCQGRGGCVFCSGSSLPAQRSYGKTDFPPRELPATR